MPGVPEAQQDVVLKRYPLRRVRIPVGSGQLSIVIPDDRAWLRQGTWASAVLRGKEPPYWCRIWPAAVAVARQLARATCSVGTSVGLTECRVLDLGCGVGVPGIQAAAMGAQVCSADFEADAVHFARWNASAHWHSQRRLHDVETDSKSEPCGQRVDWSREVVDGTFDLTLLSDVTYHRNHHAPIRRQLQRVLAENGCVLHSDPWRDLASEFLDSLDSSYERSTWQRRTAFLEHDTMVRLTLIAKSTEHLNRWRERLAVPADATHTTARRISAGADEPCNIHGVTTSSSPATDASSVMDHQGPAPA